MTGIPPSNERFIRRLCDGGATLIEVHAIGEGPKGDGKEPVGKAWQKREAVPADVVVGWLESGRNYGILPGKSGIAVLDIEPAGLTTWPPGRNPNDGLVIRTPSGGVHVYLDLEVVEGVLGRQLKKLKFENKAELFGRSGQVLGPGSRAITEKGGSRREGEYRLLRDGEPIRDEPVIRKLLEPFINRSDSRYLEAALHGAANDVAFSPEGTRNTTLNAKSYKLGSLGAPEAETKEKLVSAAMDAGLPEPEARRTADSGYAAGARNPRSMHSNGPPLGAKKGQAERSKEKRRGKQPQPYTPFPTHALPEPIRSYVESASRAIGCDPAYIALPLLAVLASVIGNARRIRLKRGWIEPAILWTTIVGESGSLKSPGLDAAVQPIRDLQKTAMRHFAEKKKQYEIEKARYDKGYMAWKKRKNDEEPPPKPEEPVPRRYYCSDITIEALAVAHQEQWRGLLILRDELAGWVRSFNQYKNGQGADTAHWLEMHGGRPLYVERKGGKPKHIFVPYSCVSITGSIQPKPLKRCMEREHFEDGLMARLFMAYPPRGEKRWTEAEVSLELQTAIQLIIKKLYELEPGKDEAGEPRPQLVDLSPDGKQAWVQFFNEHGAEQANLSGDLAAAWSKIEGGAARLALVFHLIRQANGEPGVGEAMDEKSVTAGVTVARWFAHEARRIYAILDEGEEEEDLRIRLETIQRKGGRVTVRDWQRTRGLETAEDAEAELSGLVDDDLGTWEQIPPGPKGGRPTRAFVLRPVSDTTPPPQDKTPADDSADGVSSVSVVSSEEEADLEVLSGSIRPLAGGSIPRPAPGTGVEETPSDTTDIDTTPLAGPGDGVSSPDGGVVSEDNGGWVEL